jgi:hypothetical protein
MDLPPANSLQCQPVSIAEDRLRRPVRKGLDAGNPFLGCGMSGKNSAQGSDCNTPGLFKLTDRLEESLKPHRIDLRTLEEVQGIVVGIEFSSAGVA